jgi:hypothetical protein
MSLLSMTYIINQQMPEVSQFETTGYQNEPKPIFLKALKNGLECLGWTKGGIGKLAPPPLQGREK